MFGRKQKRLILNLLRLGGEQRGLQLIQSSGGFLRRGTIYVRLHDLCSEDLVKVSKAHSQSPSHLKGIVRFYDLTIKQGQFSQNLKAKSN